MTPPDHNRLLGILHLIHGGIQLLVVMVIAIVMLGMGTVAASQSREAGAPVLAIFGLFFLLLVVTSFVFALPALFAGFGMLKQKSWAKTAGVVAGLLALLSFPLGTALGIYSLWFFFGETGKRLYAAQPGYFPPPPPARWDS